MKINTSMNTKDGTVHVAINGDKCNLTFNLASPHPSKSGKRNLRFSTGGRMPVPGAPKGLVLMINMDEQIG
jgi:hypothetical protein